MASTAAVDGRTESTSPALARSSARPGPSPLSGSASSPPRIGILGGGIAGLASAYFLLGRGYIPIILEASDRLGGLGTHFEHRGTTLDRFYHVILDTDADLCGLLADLGISDRLLWRKTGMGFHMDGALYGFNTPLDLLRFKPLAPLDRVRTGLGALYLTRRRRRVLDLDDVNAGDWLRAIFGTRVFDRIWEPLLRAKFGAHAATIPAYWVWNTLTREKNGGQEVKGYLQGGYRGLTAALEEAIVAGGGEIRLESPVTAVEPDGATVRVAAGGSDARFDAVVSTMPLPLLARIASGALAGAVPLPELNYQGVVNVVVVARRPLERFYWTIVVDPAFPFQGIVETTHVIPSEWIGQRHLIYAMNYCDADSETYRRPEALLKRQVIDGLAALYPRFRAADVEDVYVFRAPHVEPVWSVGYLKRRPPTRLGTSRVYLCTTAQAYPRVTAWNTSVALARETAATLAEDLR